MLLQTFLQNLIFNIIFTGIAYGLIKMGLLDSSGTVYYSYASIVLIFIWKNVAMNP